MKLRNILSITILPTVMALGCGRTPNDSASAEPVSVNTSLIENPKVKPVIPPEINGSPEPTEAPKASLRLSVAEEESKEKEKADVLWRNALLDSRLAAVTAFVEREPRGKVRLKIFSGKGTGRNRAMHSLLSGLDLKSTDQSRRGKGYSWERSLSAPDVISFRKEVVLRLESTGQEIKRVREQIRLAHRAGALNITGKRSFGKINKGHLVDTQNAWDLALHDSSRNARYFLAVEAGRDYPKLKIRKGETVFCRGGRLWVENQPTPRLRTIVGPIAGLQNIPVKTTGLILHSNGNVEAIGNFPRKSLGQLKVFQLSSLKNDATGRVFVSSSGERRAIDLEKSVKEGKPMLLWGKLEYPDISMQPLKEELDKKSLELKLLQKLSEINFPGQAGGINDTGASADSPAGKPNAQFVFFTDMPWSAAHLKTLGLTVHREAGRVGVSKGISGRNATDAFADVMSGLLRKMELHRANYEKGDEIKIENGKPIPYRRQLLVLEKDGRLTVKPDQSPFPKKYKPDDKFAEKETGYVVIPNVDRSVERAEFEAAAREYALLREALARARPEYIFPVSPEFPDLIPSAKGTGKGKNSSTSQTRPGKQAQ